jgi:HlyD family secretion protein
MNKRLLALPLVLALAADGLWWARQEHAAPGNELVLPGNIDIRQVDLAFNASGRVAEMLVQEGAHVAPGQVLARLDTTRLQLALNQAEALAAAQRSQVAKLKAGSRPEEVRQAAALRDAARAAVADAEQLYRRQQELVARKFVSAQQLDSARNALDAARERLKAAAETHRLAVLGPRQEDLAAAAAALQAQEAAVAGLQQDIAEGTLKAPAAGVVQTRVLEAGDMASPQKTALTLALADPLWARVYLPEPALGRIPAGARATLVTDGRPDKPYTGWVGYVAPTAEFTPKNVETAELRTSLVYQTRVFVCAGLADLRQGMPVTVRIAYDQRVDATAPPACPPPDGR